MTRERLLCVDDEPFNLLLLEDLLGDHFELETAQNGAEALSRLADGTHFDLILLDVLMPGMDGFEVCTRIKAATPEIPVLFISSLEGGEDEARGLALGAEDFIHKPFSAPVVLARVRNHLKLAATQRLLKTRNEDLEVQVAVRTRELLRQTEQARASQSATITAFCALAEARDNETGNHIRRTQHYVKALAEHLRGHPRFAALLDDTTIDMLFRSAPLHDVGKVAIPDNILHKPGRHTPEEWAIMQRHAEYGQAAIALAERELGSGAENFLRYAREIAHCHHEKWDGTGYPQGLAGEAIPFSARLMAVADVYDALISKRVYKPAFSHEKAVSIIAEGQGTHFDPDIAAAMLSIEATFRAIAQEFSDAEGENA